MPACWIPNTLPLYQPLPRSTQHFFSQTFSPWCSFKNKGFHGTTLFMYRYMNKYWEFEKKCKPFICIFWTEKKNILSNKAKQTSSNVIIRFFFYYIVPSCTIAKKPFKAVCLITSEISVYFLTAVYIIYAHWTDKLFKMQFLENSFRQDSWIWLLTWLWIIHPCLKEMCYYVYQIENPERF